MKGNKQRQKPNPLTRLTLLFAVLLTLGAIRAQDPVIVRVTEMRALRGRGVVEGDTIWASVWSTSTTGLRLAP